MDGWDGSGLPGELAVSLEQGEGVEGLGRRWNSGGRNRRGHGGGEEGRAGGRWENGCGAREWAAGAC